MMLFSGDGRRVSAHEVDGSDQEGAAGLRRVRGRLPVPTCDPRTGGDEDHIHGHSSQRVSGCYSTLWRVFPCHDVRAQPESRVPSKTR